MQRLSYVLCMILIHAALAVKVKVIMHSEQDDSKLDEEDMPRVDLDNKKRAEVTGPQLPFIKTRKREEIVEYVEDKSTTERNVKPQHPNEMIFPLIYRQNHVNSMFKFGENWYTWSTEKRTDGSKATNYYICYDEPKHCDEIGWERTDALPKCAFQIDSLMPDDRACINSFGVEPHSTGNCDGGEQLRVNEIVRSCGPRIRSLWRFVRVSRRPANVVKPADVNSLICEDEEECYVTIEYRIHHDRITFSLNEPTRGQTFKSALKREITTDEENKATTPADGHRNSHRNKKSKEDETNQRKKFHLRNKSKVEGKGVVKERNDSAYINRRLPKNRIKIREDISEDISE